jgi:hypothetical protein
MQIRCDGCGRVFAPSGLSQHLAKTRDPRCRRPPIQTHSVPVSLSDFSDRRTPHGEALAPIQASQDHGVHRDAADVTDAIAFQELSQGNVHLPTTNASEIAVDSPSDIPENVAQSNFLDPSSVVVDAFPFGNPGAPIPGVPQGRSSYERLRATLGDSNWAPFRSQRDWDIARWAKTHGTTSSAVAEFLAIPEVCAA